jgi:hypothetical protein
MPVILFCSRCKTKNEFDQKVSFRATCISCGSDLHVCNNCRYHLIGKPNDCYVPNTDPIYDREKSNFCEEFKPKEKQSDKDKKASPSDVSSKLFNDNNVDETKSFDDLFND